MDLLLYLSANDPLLAISIVCTLLGLVMLVLGLRKLRPPVDERVPIRIRNRLRRHGEVDPNPRRRRTDRQP